MNNKTLYYLGLPIVALAILLLGCAKNPAPNFHYEYFGLEQGRYVIYNVVEITHDDGLNQHDTLEYQLKTYWADTFIDNQGRTAREFKRYTRATENDPWVIQDVWTGIIDGIRGELVEENQRIVKMVFAPTRSKYWDANAANMFGEENCYYRDIHQDTIINGQEFDSTVVVVHEGLNSIIDSFQYEEMYAKNVGLIWKYRRDLHYQFDTDPPFDLYLDEGTETYYEFVSMGYE